MGARTEAGESDDRTDGRRERLVHATAAVDHVLVLRNESPTAGGATISITGGPVVAVGSDGGRAGRDPPLADRRGRSGRHPFGRFAGDDSAVDWKLSVVRGQLSVVVIDQYNGPRTTNNGLNPCTTATHCSN